MRRIVFTVLLGALVLTGVFASTTFADRVYHSERLKFALTPAGDASDHPELRSGQVVNIHPNGPVNGALERYMVNGAKPNTTYDVVLEAFADGCDGEPALRLITATLETNAQGVAHADARFTPDDLAPFSGATVSARWTLTAGGVAAYQTSCTTVTID